jgi:serine/threonine-protein kinase
VAKLLGESQAQMTQAGQAIGTVLYMSPEQLTGERVDARSDLWSAGVLAYEALAGVSPFQTDSSAATMKRILGDEPASLATVPGVPGWLAEVVSQLLRKNPAERPQSASELLKRLDKPVPSSPAMTNAFSSRAVPGTTLAAVIGITIALGGGGLYLYQQRASANQVKSLIVLPFANASGNADVEYLSDGITEGLINSLSQLHELQVIARTTAFRYKGKEVDFQRLGRDLSVDAVLTGRVQQLSDSLLIQADLVKISTGSQLWGERYERKLSGLSGVQQEITRSISEKLWPRLTGEEQRRVNKRETASSEAYQRYLRGRHLYNKRTRETMEKSVEYFQQAIDLDPQYAVAYTGVRLTGLPAVLATRECPPQS